MKRLLQSAVLALAVCTANAQGTSEAIQNFSGPVIGTWPGTMGWTFQPTANIKLMSLGCFDSLIGQYGTIAVGMWNNSGALIASNSITSSSVLINLTRYASVNPIQLNAGQTYYVGAYYAGGSMNISIVNTASGGGGSVTSAADIQTGAIVTFASGFGFPNSQLGPSGVTIGPNFRYDPVPEPSSLALLCLGGLGLAAWRARQR